MVKWIAAMALGLTLMFTGFTSAKEAKAAGLHGKVTAVAPDSADKEVTDITITVKKKGDATGTDTVIKVPNATKVTKGDADAKVSDIIIGSNIAVEKDGDKITSIKIVEHKKKA
jgi:hypothetical protein